MREKWQIGNLQGAKQLNTPRQQLAYLYFEDEPQRQMSMKRLSHDEAFLIAVNIAKLPSVPRQILKDIPRPPNTASRDD